MAAKSRSPHTALITMALRTAFGRMDSAGATRRIARIAMAAAERPLTCDVPPRPIHGGGLGQASGHPQAAEQARADIGAAGGDELLVGVQPVATLSGIQSSGTQPLGKTDDRNGGWPGEGDLDQPIQRHNRDRGCGQPFRHRADDGHAARGEVEPIRCREPKDEDDQRPRHPRQ